MDRFADLKRIGIDEVAHRKGHRYITVVVDHDTGRLLWAAEGRDSATLEGFFDLLGPERSARIQAVSADAAQWIANVVTERCPDAKQAMDPFHVVAWAIAALDAVRREVWNTARRSGQTLAAKDVKGSRWALVRNPEDLTDRQRAKLSGIQRTNLPLYRAYLLKEQLRAVFRQSDPRKAMRLLDGWISWAQRCRIAAFVAVARSVKAHRAGIEQAQVLGLSNARVESLNTRVRVLTRQAFGFGSAQAMIGMALLALGGLCPPLPGRA